jgi:hypothetical protein
MTGVPISSTAHIIDTLKNSGLAERGMSTENTPCFTVSRLASSLSQYKLGLYYTYSPQTRCYQFFNKTVNLFLTKSFITAIFAEIKEEKNVFQKFSNFKINGGKHTSVFQKFDYVLDILTLTIAVLTSVEALLILGMTAWIVLTAGSLERAYDLLMPMGFKMLLLAGLLCFTGQLPRIFLPLTRRNR